MFSKFLLFTVLVAPVFSLWPAPRQMTTGSKTIVLSSSFSITVKGTAPADLSQAIARTTSFIKNDNMGRLIVGRGSTDAASFKKALQLPGLTLKYTGSGAIPSISTEAVQDVTARNEQYTLKIPADGSAATITAPSALGLFRGLTTFEQLFYTYEGTIYTAEAPISITDSPAYPYRGFMLDTSRNYFPVPDILRTLDAMSWVKMTTFHWHIVDSNSWPLQVPSFPQLSAQGAYEASMVYSKADVSQIIAYAAARGIDVMPEFDTPGHTSVIGDAYPEHVACQQTSGAYDDTVANEPPSGQLRFAVPATSDFAVSLVKSISNLFTSKWFSTGGDEINQKCYDNDAPTQAALKAAGLTFEQALSKFTVAEHAVLTKAGKTPVVWEEMVLSHNVTLSPDTVVLVWISSADATAVAEKGFRLVHAPSDYFYLDCGGGGWLGNFVGGNSWCDPFKTWQDAYSFDPLNGITSDQAHLVLGGQQLLWTEQSGPENLDPVVWPRAAASAEVFWTGKTLPDGTAANVQNALPRLHDIRYRMVQRGVMAINLQPYWCAVRPGECDL